MVGWEPDLLITRIPMKKRLISGKLPFQKVLKLFLLILWIPFTWSPIIIKPLSPMPADRSQKASLCGKLIFLDDIKTGAKLIGLLPCGEGKPYIFNKRPDELFNYYRLNNVVIVKDKNMQVRTKDYGEIYTFIIKFEDYIAINSCGECSGFTYTATPKYIETILSCSQRILNQTFNEFKNELTEIEFESTITALEDETFQSSVEEKCGMSDTCLENEFLLFLGNELGKLFYKHSLPLQQVIHFLKKLVVDPENVQSCMPVIKNIGHLVIGLNQQGYPIEVLEVTSPASPRMTNAQGKQTGVLDDGRVVEEISDTQVVVSSWSITVFSPSNITTTILVAGTGFGSVDIMAIHNNGEEVQHAHFKGMLFTQSTRSNLETVGPHPILKVDAIGNGNVEARNPDSFDVYPLINEWWINPSATITMTPYRDTASSTPTAILTSSPTPIPTTKPTSTNVVEQLEEPSPFPPCLSIAGIIFLSLAVVIQRRSRLLHQRY